MLKDKLMINDHIENFVEKHRPHYKLRLHFGECVVEVSANSVVLLKKITHYYREFVTENNGHPPHIHVIAVNVTPPDFGVRFENLTVPGKDSVKEQFADFPDGRIVRKTLTGMQFVFGGGRNMVAGLCVEHTNQVINFINNRYIEWLVGKGYLLTHAAGVEMKGRGIALSGFSGMGKSTLALHLMGHGANFVSNDRLLIKKTGEAHHMLGIPKLPRINPGTALNNFRLQRLIAPEDRAKYAELPEQELWAIERKYDVFIDECFGKNRFTASANLDLYVILNWRRVSANTLLKEVNLAERRDLLGVLMKSLGLFFDPVTNPGPHELDEARYLQHLAGCPIVEISGGIDFHKAVELCVEYIETI